MDGVRDADFFQGTYPGIRAPARGETVVDPGACGMQLF